MDLANMAFNKPIRIFQNIGVLYLGYVNPTERKQKEKSNALLVI